MFTNIAQSFMWLDSGYNWYWHTQMEKYRYHSLDPTYTHSWLQTVVVKMNLRLPSKSAPVPSLTWDHMTLPGGWLRQQLLVGQRSAPDVWWASCTAKLSIDLHLEYHINNIQDTLSDQIHVISNVVSIVMNIMGWYFMEYKNMYLGLI